MPRRSLILILMLPLAATACDDPAGPGDARGENLWADIGKPCPADAPAYSVPAAARDSLVDRSNTSDAVLAEIAREVPGGWGGMFYDDEGSLTIYLVDPSKRDQAIDALIPRLEEAGWGQVAEDLPTANVKDGRWDFAQLHDWYRYLFGYTFSIDGVTSGDIEVPLNRIEFGVKDDEVRQSVSEVLAGLDLPCFLVALQIVPPARPL